MDTRSEHTADLEYMRKLAHETAEALFVARVQPQELFETSWIRGDWRSSVGLRSLLRRRHAMGGWELHEHVMKAFEVKRNAPQVDVAVTIRALVYLGGNGDLYHVTHELHEDRNLASAIRNRDPEAMRRGMALGVEPGVTNRYVARRLAADEMGIPDWEWKVRPGKYADDPQFLSDVVAKRGRRLHRPVGAGLEIALQRLLRANT